MIKNETQNTWSLCPVCLKRIPAKRNEKGKEIYLEKYCSEHGTFETIIWRGYSDFNSWLGNAEKTFQREPACPDNYGICTDHIQNTCCVILNITHQCNLNCRFCVADNKNIKELSLEEIKEALSNVIEKNKTLLQLSGGEPTMRDDLPQIIQMAKNSGAKYVQLNTNGIRLAEDKTYTEELAKAGLSFVFLQFDGTDDSIYQYIRNRPLLEIKKKAIEHCADFNIGVTLVPTIVREINSQNIGSILRFAFSQVPNIRGVHFQPVTYMGRIPYIPSTNDRFTLDELLFEIQQQTEGIIKMEDLLPSACDHPLCGFHGDFVIDKEQIVSLLNRKTHDSCCGGGGGGSSMAEKNREFVARRWQRPLQNNATNEIKGDLQDMEYFLKRVHSNGFTITAMAFQDAGNIDLARLHQCSLHVYDHGHLKPFCSYNLTPWNKQ